MADFSATFSLMLKAMLQLLLVGVLGGFLVRRTWVTQEQVKSMAAMTVNVLLPCMILANILKQFKPSAIPNWWILPILGVALSGAGLLMAWLLFRKELPSKNLMLAIAAFQNSGYMALPLGKMAYPDQFDRFALLTFLFLLGYSPMLWSLGKRLTTCHAGSIAQPIGGGWRGFMTPPFVANVMAVFLVLTGVNALIPGMVVESAELLGSATVPIATFVLGATVGGIALRVWPPWWDAARAIGVKLVLLPALLVTVMIVLTAWTTLRVEPLLGNFLVIQAASAPATALALQVRKYGGDEQQTGSLLLLSYALCTLTLPLWLGLWNVAGH